MPRPARPFGTRLVQNAEYAARPVAGARGFTLIELLVVVAIIAMLLAILTPSLGRARQASKGVVCLSNLRTLAVAVQMYADSNRGVLITAGLAHGGSVDEHAAWINTLRHDYGNKMVARCPADRSVHWKVPVEGTTQLRRASFGTNYYTVKKIGNRGPYNRPDQIRRPSSTILMVELAEEGQYAATDHVHPETWWSDPLTLAGEELQYTRHLGKANYSFIDSHAEPFKFEQTYQLDPAGGFPPQFLQNKYDPEIGR